MTAIEGFRLSPQQRRLWRAGSASQFRAQCLVSIDGAVSDARLVQALERVVSRHEILRSTFALLPGTAFPLQVVRQNGGVSYRSHAEASAEDLIAAEASRSLDLEEDAALRAAVARSCFVLTLPALCADPRTLVNIVAEIGKDLGGGVPDEAVQYSAFSEWRREMLAGHDAAAGRAFWAAHDFDRPAVRLLWEQESSGFRPSSYWVPLDPSLLADLASPSDFLLGVWTMLLCRLTGSADVVVGVTADDRRHEELETALGLFAQPVPVSAVLDPHLPVADALARVEHASRQAQAWQESFDDERRPFPFQLSVERWPAPIAAGNARLRYQWRSFCAEPFHLRLSVVETFEGPRLEFAYDASRYSSTAIEYLARSFTTLAGSARADAQAPLSALESMCPRDRRTVLVDWSQTAAERHDDRSLSALFEEQVERVPDNPAVVFRGDQVSFRELNDRADRIASHLRRLGVGQDALVAIGGERSIDLIAALIGVLKSGGAYVPLDPWDPPERLRQILEDARPKAMVLDRRLRDTLSHCGIPALDVDCGATAPALPGDRCAVARGDNLAYAIYTSGSTGRPKGVLVSRHSVRNLLEALERVVYHGRHIQRVSLNAPLTFDASVKQWIQLLRGRTLHVIPDEIRLDPRAMAAHLAESPIEVFDCTPTQLRPMLEGPLSGPAVVLTGGEPIDEPTWRRMTGHETVTFFNVYGPTEFTVDATACAVAVGPPSIGRPLVNTRVYLVERSGDPAVPGTAGEICLGGAGLARGYLHRPDLTAERFVPDPFSTEPGARLYRTGDFARHAPDGTLEFIGRRDQQVKIRGHRIELGEIEGVLAEHTAVRQAAVFVRGEPDRPAIVACVAGDVSAYDLAAFLRRRLPEWMVPSDFVVVDRLPLTTRGKIDRSALAELSRQPVARTRAPEVAPQTDLERTIAQIWRRVLEVERVGIHDNFFDVGGHSLLLARTYEELRQVSPVDFSLLEMFRHPTVSALAAYLSNRESAPSAEPIRARAARQREAMAERRPTSGGRGGTR